MSLANCPQHGPYVADTSTDFGERNCPECGKAEVSGEAWPQIPGPDPGACPDCGQWRKAGMVHECREAKLGSIDLADALAAIRYGDSDAAGKADAITESHDAQEQEVARLTAALKDAERELVLWRRGHAEQVKRADDAERERERLEAEAESGSVTVKMLMEENERLREALQEPAPQGEAGERPCSFPPPHHADCPTGGTS